MVSAQPKLDFGLSPFRQGGWGRADHNVGCPNWLTSTPPPAKRAVRRGEGRTGRSRRAAGARGDRDSWAHSVVRIMPDDTVVGHSVPGLNAVAKEVNPRPEG